VRRTISVRVIIRAIVITVVVRLARWLASGVIAVSLAIAATTVDLVGNVAAGARARVGVSLSRHYECVVGGRLVSW